MTTGVPAGTKLGRYEVVKHLARGGMADLSVARASGIQGFERHVVIKHLRPEQSEDEAFVKMFVAEARLAGALHHHNIVQVHDIGNEQGRHFFAMEYVHGEDVRNILRRLRLRNEQPPLEHAVAITTAVAAALHHAHEQKGSDRKPLGIVHRDVTPGNIIVGYDGNVKVVDFGIAKAALGGKSDTQVGMLKGKVPYMAPEQCTGKPVDRRSDVFALGIVLYEIVTVRRLFKGGNEYYTMSAVVSGEIPPPSKHRKDLPKELENIILKALSRNPAHRYQTADEMRAALEAFADKVGLRMSASALVSYMKKLFGERPEPWMSDAAPAVEAEDFDKTDTGLAPIPVEVIENSTMPKSMAATRGSLIDQARLNVISSSLEPVKTPRKPILPAPKKPNGAQAAKPIVATAKPDDKPIAATPPPIPPASADRAKTDVDEPPTDVKQARSIDTTDIASPPPPPQPPQMQIVIEATMHAERESTAIVTPLPPPSDRARSRGASASLPDEDPAPATGNRTWLLVSGLAGVALVVAIVVVVTGSKSVAPKKQEPALIDLKAAENQPAALPVATDESPSAPVVPEPVAVPSPDVVKPPDVAKPPEVASPDVVKPIDPVVAEPPVAPPVVADPPSVVAAPPTKPPAKPKPPVAVKPAKPAKPTPAPAKPPTWDPDALFLNKKK